MRTKTLLLTAAVLAAGMGASMAQVYSVNAVGYVNVSLSAGYNLIANPLNGTNNNINTVVPTAPGDSVLVRWNPATQGFRDGDIYYDVGDPAQNGWYNGQLEKSSTVLNPGEAFFIQVPTATTLTFVGEVPQGSLTNQIAANFGFYSSIVPQAAGVQSMSFPGAADMTYSTWNAATQRYNDGYVYYDVGDPAQNGWYDSNLVKVDPAPAVGQGFLIYNPGGAVNWTRSFSVNN